MSKTFLGRAARDASRIPSCFLVRHGCNSMGANEANVRESTRIRPQSTNWPHSAFTNNTRLINVSRRDTCVERRVDEQSTRHIRVIRVIRVHPFEPSPGGAPSSASGARCREQSRQNAVYGSRPCPCLPAVAVRSSLRSASHQHKNERPLSQTERPFAYSS